MKRVMATVACRFGNALRCSLVNSAASSTPLVLFFCRTPNLLIGIHRSVPRARVTSSSVMHLVLVTPSLVSDTPWQYPISISSIVSLWMILVC